MTSSDINCAEMFAEPGRTSKKSVCSHLVGIGDVARAYAAF